MLARPAEPSGTPEDRDRDGGQYDADEQADADLLQNDHCDVPGRAAFDLGADGELEQDDDDRYADAIVQAAFQVQRFTCRCWDGGVGNDRCAECGVGRREKRCQQCDFKQAEMREDEQPDQEAEHDGQRQADQQQPPGQPDGASHDSEISVRGIREQHHRKRELCQCAQYGGRHWKSQRVDAGRAEDQPRSGKEDRSAQRGASDAPGPGAIEQHHGGKDRGVFVHGVFLELVGCRSGRRIYRLLVDLGHRVAQRRIGNSHDAAVGLVQFKDEEYRARHRERADQQRYGDGRVDAREQTEAKK